MKSQTFILYVVQSLNNFFHVLSEGKFHKMGKLTAGFAGMTNKERFY